MVFEMKLTILGSGTYDPVTPRAASSYLVETGENKLVFDFGRGVLGQLLKCGVKYTDIDAIFISHNHCDHLGEISSFLFIACNQNPYGSKREKEITIYGPPGFEKTMKLILKSFEMDINKPKLKINIKELEFGQSVSSADWKITGFESKHNRKGLCYRIESENKTIAYSGDTMDCPGLRKAVKDADIAIIESSFPDEVLDTIESSGHSSASTTARVSKECNVKKLILTHIEQYYLDNFDIKAEAKKQFPGTVLIAEDLMEIEI